MLFSVVGSPPPLMVQDSSRCEFAGAAVNTNITVVGISCCGTRRGELCSNQSVTETSCWLGLVTKTRNAAPEPREMAKKPPRPHCVDCRSGIVCFRHGGICGKVAATACGLCTKYQCEGIMFAV